MVGVSDDVQIFLLAVTSVLILVGVMAVFMPIQYRDPVIPMPPEPPPPINIVNNHSDTIKVSDKPPSRDGELHNENCYSVLPKVNTITPMPAVKPPLRNDASRIKVNIETNPVKFNKGVEND
jgi:hypothetical protein